MSIKKSYTSGHFELSIDGQKTTAYLKSLDGGWGRQAVVDERIGPENMSIKHGSVADVDPFSFEFGMSGANKVLSWIQDSWRKDPKPANGEITHANFNLQSTFSHEFQGAYITETTLPALDGASKEAAYIKVKAQPYATKISPANGERLRANMGQKQKMWLCSGFRLNIDGIDDLKYTNKIESFTIKQGVKKMYTGMYRHAELIPTKIEFPNIVGTISMEHSHGVMDWYKSYGQRHQAAEDRLDRVLVAQPCRCPVPDQSLRGWSRLRQRPAEHGERRPDQACEVRAVRWPHGDGARRQQQRIQG
jgi:hypothetical protein